MGAGGPDGVADVVVVPDGVLGLLIALRLMDIIELILGRSTYRACDRARPSPTSEPPDQPPGQPPAALEAVGRTVAAPHGGVLVSVNEKALDVLHDLLRQLAARHLPTGRFFGADGGERLMIPQYRFDDFVDLAVGEIWHYDSGAAQIPDKIARLLSDIDQAALPEHRPAVARWLRRIQEAARPPAAGPRP